MKNSAVKAAFAALSVLMLSACGTGTVIHDDGTTDEPKWHEAGKVTFNKDRGTFPNLQGLSQIRSGMTKDQLYELIGRPQYHDGWRPREWNYLFHFSTPGVGPDGITTCQYKVLFDTDGFARSFHWNPVEPEGAVCPPPEKSEEKPAAVPVPAPLPPPALHTFTLSGDALFAFDRYTEQDLNPEGVTSLEELIGKINELGKVTGIHILAYTDRLGSEQYNLRLSERRAATIRSFFTKRGFSAMRISAVGMGEADQVKPCTEEGLRGQELRDCLHPNRRVVVEVEVQEVPQAK